MADRSLWVKLGLDKQNYEKGMKQAQGKTNTMRKTVGKLGGAIAGAFATQQITQYINSTIKAIGMTNRMSERLGVGVEAMQELQYAAKQFDVGTDALRDGLKELTMRVDEFAQTGKGPAADVMENLGITRKQAEQLKGNTEALFTTMVDKISEVGNTAEKQRIADELFGGQGGEQLVEMVSSGTEALEGFRKEARETGNVLSQEQTKNVEDFRDTWKELTAYFSSGGKQAVAALSAALDELAQGVIWVIEKIKAFQRLGDRVKKRLGIMSEGTENATKKFDGLNKAVEFTNGLFDELNKKANESKDTIEEHSKSFELGVSSIQAHKEKLEELSQKMRKLSPQQEGQIEKIQQQKQEIKELLKQIKNLNEEGKAGTPILNLPKMPETADLPAPKATPELDTSKMKFAGDIKKWMELADKGKQKMTALGNITKNVFQGMQNSLQKALDKGENILDSFGKFFMDMLKSLIIKLTAAAVAAFTLSLLLGGTNIGGMLGVGSSFGSGGFGQAFGAITGMQSGGKVDRAGNFIVGEQGPEMLTLPKGSKVTPNSEISNIPQQKGNGQDERLVARVTGDQLDFVLERNKQKNQRLGKT